MNHVDQRLDAAIDDLLAGGPAAADFEMRPLLGLGAALMALNAPPPASPVCRQRLHAALKAERARGHRRPWRLFNLHGFTALPRFAAVAAILLLILAFWTSATALPGDPRYVLKRSAEVLPLLVSRQPDDTAQRHVTHAGRRLDEIERLLVAGRPVPAQLANDVSRSWQAALGAAGDPALLRDHAGQQAERLRQLLPFLQGETRLAAEAALTLLAEAEADSGPPAPPALPAPTIPSPTPAPSATATFDASVELGPTATQRAATALTPNAAATVGPQPSATVASTTPLAVGATSTPGAALLAASATPSPLPTDDDTGTPEPDDTPQPTSTSEPATTSTFEPTATAPSDDTPEPDESPEPEDTPEADETAGPDESPEPESAP